MQAAYRTTAAILIGLAHAFGKPEGDAFKVWERLAACEKPEVILPPAVTIGNYCPVGHAPKAGDEGLFASRGLNFSQHKEKLERHGVRLHEVGKDHNGPKLPLLGALSVSI